MASKSEFAFSRINFILLGVAIVVILLGFVLMSGEGSTQSAFNPEIFSTRRIVVAPMVCLLGYLLIIVAILYRPRCEAKAPLQTSESATTIPSEA